MKRRKIAKILLIVSLVIIITLSIVVWFFQQTVRISYFSLNGYSNPVGVMWDTAFIVRIQNNSSLPVIGLTLTFNVISNYTIDRELFLNKPDGAPYSAYKMGQQIDLAVLNQGKTKEVKGEIINSLGDSAKLHGSSFVVTLKLYGIALDERIITLS